MLNAPLTVGDVVFDIGLFSLNIDRFYGCRETNFPAEFFEEFDQRADQGVGSSFGEVNAPFSLEVVNQGVDGRGLEGVAAHQEGVETQGLSEVIVFNVFRHGLVDGSVSPQSHQRG